MRTLRKYILLFLKILFPACAAAVFLETVLHFYSDLTHFFYKGYILLAVLYGVLFLLFMHMYEGTRLDTQKLRNLILSDAIALFFSNAIIYIVISLIALRFFNPLALLGSMLVQLTAFVLLNIICVAIIKRLFPRVRSVALTSGSEADAEAINSIAQHDPKHYIGEIINESEITEPYDSLKEFNTVIIGSLKHETRAKLLTYCYNSGKEVLIIPAMQDILLNNSTQYIVGDKLLYTDKYEGFSTAASFIKRTFDIVFSLLGIIISSPVMAIVAIMIKSYDKGPVFFKQTRLTRNGKEFKVIKFRSMIQNAEKKGGTFLVLEGDDRITPVGRFIRSARIDELPQLFNILKGDMSFVGPRPERPELYEIYCKTCPEFRYRLKVKAGLTGYAQVYGKYNTSAEDKVRLDLLYIEKASLVQDLQLMLYTLKIIFVKESTEGIKDIDKAAKK